MALDLDQRLDRIENKIDEILDRMNRIREVQVRNEQRISELEDEVGRLRGVKNQIVFSTLFLLAGVLLGWLFR